MTVERQTENVGDNNRCPQTDKHHGVVIYLLCILAIVTLDTKQFLTMINNGTPYVRESFNIISMYSIHIV